MVKLEKKSRPPIIKEIIEKMQEDNTIVVVEGLHDINALNNIVEYLSEKGLIKNKQINAITLSKLMNNHIGGSKQKFIIAMDNDRRGEEKRGQAVALIREKYPYAAIDEFTGRSLLKLLGVTCIEGLVAPIKESYEKIKR